MKTCKLSIVLAVLFFGFFVFANQWLPIMDPVESNYALTAKEMVLSGDWISPQIYHKYWFDKPIMIYWLIALSYKVFGFSDFAARFPSALFGALTIGLLYQMVYRISNRKLLSFWSVLILGTSLEFWVVSHGVVTDMVLMFATVGTMGYAYVGLEQNKPWYTAVAYAFAGLAVLTKGPVGIVLPGLLLLIFACIMGPKTYVKRLFPWQGILAFILVALPWYAAMYYIHGQAFVDGFLGLHNYVRATVSEHPEDNKWYYYLVILPASLLPWTGIVFYDMWKGRRKDFRYIYLMTWGWGTILFYTLMATKYPTYTFIALIPFSVMGAMGIVHLLHYKKKRYWTILTGPAIFLWLLLVVATFFVKWGFWALLYLVVGLGTVSVIYLQFIGRKFMLPLVIAIVTMLSSAVVIYEGLIPFVNQRSSVELVKPVADFKGPVYSFGGYKTSLVYYTGKEITRIEAIIPGQQTGVWANKYTMKTIDRRDILPHLQKGEDMLLVVPRSHEGVFAESVLYPYVEQVFITSDKKTKLYRTKGQK